MGISRPLRGKRLASEEASYSSAAAGNFNFRTWRSIEAGNLKNVRKWPKK
jgi:hypothetical protein